jgi:quercetin dioxygenase-like cupin family protein
MKLFNIKDMTRGWIVGDFEPSILRTKDFEVGLLTHKKGEVWPKHYHALATEYNVLIEGSMTVQGTQINPGDIFIFEPMEIADPVFHEDCKVLCVKVPSVIGDKHEPL